MAKRLQAHNLTRHFVISCGIHIDNITKEQIGRMVEACSVLTDKIEAYLSNREVKEQ